jgi:uncharacterized protein YbjT (DUF2867 family)
MSVEKKVVIVAGATGYLGLKIVAALLAQGARVKALVRATSDRSGLEALGVADFAVGDMMDRGSLKAALAQNPAADALVASAAGYTGHSKGDSPKTDTEGYRNLVDAAREAALPRFVLVSILESDKAVTVPHFHRKYLVEEYLKKQGQPFIALRAGAFLDQARDMVLPQVKKGIYPEFFHSVALGMVYTPDLARYAAQAAISLPGTALGRSVDIGWATPATGSALASAFSRVLGKPVEAKPAFPALATKVVMPFMGLFNEGVRDMSAMMKWVGSGVYVSRDPQAQKELFGELPTLEEAVARYCRDRGLGPETA